MSDSRSHVSGFSVVKVELLLQLVTKHKTCKKTLIAKGGNDNR